MSERSGERDPRPADRPAPVVSGKARSDEWVYDVRQDDDDGNYVGQRSMQNAVRVSIEEAAALQSFPSGYAFAGSRSKQFEQIGNAVPPLMARAILEALVRDA